MNGTNSCKLIAFHNKKSVQKKYLSRVEKHSKLDEIIKGKYWEGRKGCAVGCTVHSDSHNCYEIELGIPEWVARLEDILFEGMSNGKAKEFPLKFLQSIPLGFHNWQHVYHQLCVFMLEKICKNTDNEIVVKAICDIITLHKTESKDESAWSAAESAAWSAARSAARSAGSAARSARSAARSARSAAGSAESAAWSAESAAWSAAGSAESAARSAESAARSARSAESAARSARSARSAAGSAAYKSIADKLIEILEKEK